MYETINVMVPNAAYDYTYDIRMVYINYKLIRISYYMHNAIMHMI